MTVFCKFHLQFQLFYSQKLLCFLFEKAYHAICKTNKTNQQNITTTCYKKDSLAVLSEFSSWISHIKEEKLLKSKEILRLSSMIDNLKY